MKKTVCAILLFALLTAFASASGEAPVRARLLYQGHASLRIVTAEGMVIYIDPYAGEGYDLPADLILVTHNHSDHNAVKVNTKPSTSGTPWLRQSRRVTTPTTASSSVSDG